MASPDFETARMRVSSGEEIHVWKARLIPDAESRDLLSDDERVRADNLRSLHDRRRFVAARSTLRRVLGGYEGIPPERLRFAYGPNGKPSLPGSSLRFNLSHTADLALLAIALGHEVGVDLEVASVLLDPESVVRRCMSRRERGRLDKVDLKSREDAILTCWVRKEAVAKGRGEGLGLDLTLIQTRPGMPAEATGVKVRANPRDRWFVWDVPVGEGGSGAVAARERGLRIRLFDYVPSVIDLTALTVLPDAAPVATMAT